MKKYRLARGLYKDYQPLGQHLDSIFYCLDKRISYLNGIPYDGGSDVVSINGVVNKESDLPSSPNPDDIYFCSETKSLHLRRDNAWIKEGVNNGTFFNVGTYENHSNIQMTFNGNSLVHINGVVPEISKRTNEMYFWYEGD